MTGPEHSRSLDGAVAGIEELAGLINFRTGAWQDFGYAEPPAPECAAIPPLGERSARAIEAGHEAVKDIDQLIARLHQVRAQLVSELRQDEDVRAARTGGLTGQPERDPGLDAQLSPPENLSGAERAEAITPPGHQLPAAAVVPAGTDAPMRSYIVTWEDPAGGAHANQVHAPDRDNAIWRLALLMQTPRPDLGKFISCEEGSLAPQHAAGTDAP